MAAVSPRKEDILVHLIFSDGNGLGGDDERYQIYSIALFPFALGIPPENVYFTVDPRLVEAPGLIKLVADASPKAAGSASYSGDYFPESYFEYFETICKKASGFEALKTIPACSFRIVSGHGLPFNKTGRLVCGKWNIPFYDMGAAASILTILDVCNSQFAVAALSGHYDENKNRRLRNRERYVTQSEALFACDNMDYTYAFRVGDNDNFSTPAQDFEHLSRAIGDAVICSVLMAAYRFLNSDQTVSLDDLFATQFNLIHANFLDGEQVRSPESRLHRIQAMLVDGTLSLNEEAFRCKIFQYPNQWYFTTERMPNNAISGDLKQNIVDYVVASVQLWHTANPGLCNHKNILPASQLAWRHLEGMLGHTLKSVRLDDAGGAVHRDNDGTLFVQWAETCKDLPQILRHVLNLMASGSFDDSDEEPSDLDLPPIAGKEQSASIIANGHEGGNNASDNTT